MIWWSGSGIQGRNVGRNGLRLDEVEWVALELTKNGIRDPGLASVGSLFGGIR